MDGRLERELTRGRQTDQESSEDGAQENWDVGRWELEDEHSTAGRGAGEGGKERRKKRGTGP